MFYYCVYIGMIIYSDEWKKTDESFNKVRMKQIIVGQRYHHKCKRKKWK